MRCLLVGLTCLAAPLTAHADCTWWRVVHNGAALRMVSSPLPTGKLESVVLDGQNLAGVVVVTGEGQSGDVVQATPPIHVDARCVGDTLALSVRRGDAPSREVMRMSAAALRALRVTVNVTGGDGVSARFRIDGWERAEQESLPVVDLLRGAVPLGPRDHSITTIVEAIPSGGASVSGEVAVQMRSGYPLLQLRTTSDQPALRAVVDFAAATTIVRRNALPPGVNVRSATMRQQSANGVQILPLAGEGAGGAVTGFRAATIPSVMMGSAQLENVDVLVLDSMPVIDGAPIDAIVGLDVLRNAGQIRFTRLDDHTGTIAFGTAIPKRAAATAELPLQTVGALNGVTARFGATDAFLVLDSGSPHTVLSNAAATVLHLTLVPVAGRAPRGLDGAPLTMRQGRVPSLTLGAMSLADVNVRVADLPVLAKITAPRVGLLGFDVMSRLSAMEIDFTAERVRFWR